MVKVLAQAGNSLADIYDVEGSIAGIEHLETHDLPIVHEMGATVFSERISANIRRGTSGATAASTAFDVDIPLGAAPVIRILALSVFTTVTARLDHVTASMHDVLNGREIPIFAWDTNDGGTESAVRVSLEGAAAAEAIMLVPRVSAQVNMPNMIIGSGQPNGIPEIAFRGITTAFGAGTVTCTVLVQQCFPFLRGISSRGLPVPSW